MTHSEQDNTLGESGRRPRCTRIRSVDRAPPCIAGVSLALTDGDYDYKYMCGGAWCLDPSEKAYADASGANKNHHFIVRYALVQAAREALLAHRTGALKPSLDPVPHHISPRASPTEGVSVSTHSPGHAGGGLGGGYAAASEHGVAMHPAVGVAAGEPSPGNFGHFGAAVKVHSSAATQGPVALPAAAHAASHAPAVGVAAGAIPQRR